jgi:multiple sugar transport system substrate-binding protein
MQSRIADCCRTVRGRNATPALIFGALAAVAGGAGCDSAATPPSAPAAKRIFAGVSLTIGCPDPAFAAELRMRAAGWAARTGATVTVAADPAAADLAVIPPADLGALAARGDLAPLPDEYTQPSHPLQWNAMLPAYSRTLSGWGGKVVGLPLAGDGAVLVLRADRLTKTDRPTSWGELAELAAAAHTRDGKPSLAPLPADPTALATTFFRVAASMDRKAVTLGAGGKLGEGALGFQFDLSTGRPRLTAPGFVAAAEWLARTQKFRPPTPSDDPVAALASGTAVAAVLSLADVARLPRDPATGAVAGRYAVAKLPAGKVVFDKDGRREDAPGAGNYVPYLGPAAKVGVVFARSGHAAAAWDFLADAAGVTGGLSTMGNPTLGAGPFRGEQVEEARSAVWQVYGFDPAGTRALADAVRYDLALEAGNPTTVLRVPGQAEMVAALAKHLRRAAAGEVPPAAALAAAAAEWEAIAAKAPKFKEWLRAAAGLQ